MAAPNWMQRGGNGRGNGRGNEMHAIPWQLGFVGEFYKMLGKLQQPWRDKGLQSSAKLSG